MKLPNLSDLELEVNSSVDEPEVDNKKVKKKPVKAKEKQVDPKKEKKPKKEPIIPKTQYDSEGNPMLAIPDLDDVDLTSEIDRFFGKGGD